MKKKKNLQICSSTVWRMWDDARVYGNNNNHISVWKLALTRKFSNFCFLLFFKSKLLYRFCASCWSNYFAVPCTKNAKNEIGKLFEMWYTNLLLDTKCGSKRMYVDARIDGNNNNAYSSVRKKMALTQNFSNACFLL